MKTAHRFLNTFHAARRAFALRDGATPHERIPLSGPVSLRRYAADPEAPPRPPIVFVTPIINRSRLFDLAPNSSLVGGLAARGHDVTLIDWGSPRRIDAGTSFRDYIERYIPRAMEAVAGDEPVTIAGVCLGGTLATMTAARYPKRIAALITIVAPIDFRPMELMRRWTEKGHFPIDKLMNAFGVMPGPLVGQGFDWQDPIGIAKKGPRLWERFEDRSFAESAFVLESWNRDNVDVPGAAYRRLIKDLYRDNALYEGRFKLGRRALKLEDITAPALVIAGARDGVCKPEAARALLDKASGENRYHEEPGGHTGVFLSPKSRPRVLDLFSEWTR